MAYGEPLPAESFPQPMLDSEFAECIADVPFGIAKGLLIPDEATARINAAEAEAIRQRRSKLGVNATDGQNAVGLALSGGGIRSATFCLGVAQGVGRTQLA